MLAVQSFCPKRTTGRKTQRMRGDQTLPFPAGGRKDIRKAFFQLPYKRPWVKDSDVFLVIAGFLGK